MFEKDKPQSSRNTETIIGSSVKVKGSFTSSGNVIVKGEVEGTLKTHKDLKVEKGAVVKANVAAENVYLAGEIQGNLKAKERIRLSGSAKLSGDIVTKLLAIDEGASFNGRCSMGEEIEKVKIKEEVGKEK